MASQKPSRARSGQASGSTGNNTGRASSSKRGTSSGRATTPDRTAAGNSGGIGAGDRPGRPGRNATVAGQSRPAAGKAGPRPAAPPQRSASGPQAQAAAPRWLQLTTLLLSLFGLGVSIYLTIAHYNTKVTLACPDTGLVNCAKVTTSAQSVFLGIPVAVLGLAFFVFMVAANSPWAWRSKMPAIYWARLGSVVVGMLFVLYLVYSEIVTIGNICLWCTSVHVLTFLLFALLVFYASSPANRPARAASPTVS